MKFVGTEISFSSRMVVIVFVLEVNSSVVVAKNPNSVLFSDLGEGTLGQIRKKY